KHSAEVAGAGEGPGHFCGSGPQARATACYRFAHWIRPPSTALIIRGKHSMTQPPGPQGPYPQHPQGQPPSGGFPQQQPGFGPPQGQPGGYGPPQGQPGGYGPPQGPPPGFPPTGGFPGGEQPKKSPLPWIFGGVGALVVIGGVSLLIVLLGGGGTSDPESAANTALDYMKDGDLDGLASMTCEEFKGQLEKAKELGGGDISTGIPDGVSAEVTEVKEVDDNTAEATFTATQDEKQKQAKFK